jgi:hypothetical protein
VLPTYLGVGVAGCARSVHTGIAAGGSIMKLKEERNTAICLCLNVVRCHSVSETCMIFTGPPVALPAV